MKLRLLKRSYFISILSFHPSITFTAIPQQQFSEINQILVLAHQNKILEKTDHQLVLLELWHNFGGAFLVDSLRKTVGEKSLVLTLTGAVPKNSAIHTDGYAITACHEIGHGLGGAPKQTPLMVSWSSVEMQADYYATNQCMWVFVSLFEGGPSLNLDDKAKKLCEQAFSYDIKKMEGCLRIISGIISMQDYFNDTSSKQNHVSIYKKDMTAVNKTLEKFSSNQCRLDTMMAGLFNEPRPSCWYKE